MTLRSNQLLTEMRARNIPGGKGSRPNRSADNRHLLVERLANRPPRSLGRRDLPLRITLPILYTPNLLFINQCIWI